MARFYGEIGYADQVVTAPGVWSDVIVGRNYYGDVTRITRKMEEDTNKLNDNLNIGHSFSVVADAYAYEHFFNVRYIKWSGKYWKVTDVTVERPRLLLRVGGVYNGDKA